MTGTPARTKTSISPWRSATSRASVRDPRASSARPSAAASQANSTWRSTMGSGSEEVSKCAPSRILRAWSSRPRVSAQAVPS